MKEKSSSKKKKEKKGVIYVIDTNVLMNHPEVIEELGDSIMVIPMTVIEELDGLKSKRVGMKGYSARNAIALIDSLKKDGNLRKGVVANNSGGILKVRFSLLSLIGIGFKPITGRADDRILLSTIWIAFKELLKGPFGKRVVLKTNDKNLQIKAQGFNLEAEGFLDKAVRSAGPKLYTGCKEIYSPEDKVLLREQGVLRCKSSEYVPNQFVIMNGDSGKSVIGIFKAEGSIVRRITKRRKVFGITPLNQEQHMVMEALMDPEISLVTISGLAGSGKTLLCLAAALEQVRKGPYKRVLAYRPTVEMGKDIGYLPGDKNDKLKGWMTPVYDNVALLEDGLSCATFRIVVEEKGIEKEKKVGVKEFIKHNLQVETLYDVRGRSIPGMFIIVDEAQNMTPLEAKTIVSRCGKDTKIVLCGDPSQIDHKNLSSRNNGLIYTAETLKWRNFTAHVKLIISERSELAQAAAEDM